MQTVITLSRRNIRGVWIIFSMLFIYWAVLLLTSGTDLRLVWTPLGMLAVLCFGLPAIGTFCIYVTIDGSVLTVPMSLFFRRSIQIKDIMALRLRRHGLGLLESISVEYLHDGRRLKIVRLPSISTFGKVKSIRRSRELSRIEISRTYDPRPATRTQ
jgi:hypothetical protein